MKARAGYGNQHIRRRWYRSTPESTKSKASPKRSFISNRTSRFILPSNHIRRPSSSFRHNLSSPFPLKSLDGAWPVSKGGCVEGVKGSILGLMCHRFRRGVLNHHFEVIAVAECGWEILNYPFGLIVVIWCPRGLECCDLLVAWFNLHLTRSSIANITRWSFLSNVALYLLFLSSI
jgi:hypothetical protein